MNFAEESMEVISYYGSQTSSHLAVELGAYSTVKGSLWDQGILPIDYVEIVAKSRPDFFFSSRRRHTRSLSVSWARRARLVLSPSSGQDRVLHLKISVVS